MIDPANIRRQSHHRAVARYWLTLTVQVLFVVILALLIAWVYGLTTTPTNIQLPTLSEVTS